MQTAPSYADRRWDAPKLAPPAKDMSRLDWRGLLNGLLKFFREEMAESEHARDAQPALSTSPNSAIPTGAGVMLVDPTQHVLFVKRSASCDHPGTWAFPGGRCEGEETTQDCALRETQEEIGYDYDGALEELCRHSGDIDYTTYQAFCDNRFNPRLNDEHTAHLWAPWGQWPEDLHPGVEQVLEGLDDLGEDADMKRNRDGTVQATVDLGTLQPRTKRRLREEGMLARAQVHPGPKYNGSEAADMALDRASVREKDADGRLHVEVSNISKAAINEYMGHEIPDFEKLRLDPNRRYKLFRDPAEIAKAVDTFNNLPVLSKHVPVSAVNYQPDLVIGSTGTDAEFVAPFLRNSLVIWAKPAIDAIESGEQKELSSAYRYVAEMTPGSYEGQSYDGKMTQLVGNHIALVRAGRAGADVAIGDSLLSQDREWATLERALLQLEEAA